MAAVSVIATSEEGTATALRAGMELAAGGVSRVWLFVRAGATSALPRIPELNDATILRYSGRDVDLLQLVPTGGLVIVGGGGGRWWPTPEQQLARMLARLGYRVIFALSETSRSARAAPLPCGPLKRLIAYPSR